MMTTNNGFLFCLADDNNIVTYVLYILLTDERKIIIEHLRAL